MEIHNWADVIKFCQEKRGEIYLWNYITALRSCDGASDNWKALITCLIRGECNIAWNITETRNYIKRIVRGDTEKHIRGLYESTITTHYRNHSMEGFMVLSEYYEDIDSITAGLFRNLACSISPALNIEKMIEIETKILNRLFRIQI